MKKFLKWFGIIMGSLLLLIAITAASLYWYYNGFESEYPSGGKLSANQAAYDVHFYDINLQVSAEKQRISGYTTILLEVKKDSFTVIELDLLDGYAISFISVNEDPVESFEYSNHKIIIPLQNSFMAGQKLAVKIDYQGEPIEAKRPPWLGGFTWSHDSAGNDWVSLSCQGEGAKIWIPCKDHPSDEADSVAINITVPEKYYVAANGLLRSTSVPQPGYKTYHWFTANPINNYLINFGIGMFEIVEKEYTALDGTSVPVIFYVLPQMRNGAEDLLDQAVDMLQVYRIYFGEYPWINEKLGLLNTDFYGMEHQTLIAYGNEYRDFSIAGLDFDKLLLHEMGHEWWGNKVSANDWADFWIQEGICTYGEALYVREKGGEEAYHKMMAYYAQRIWNRNPLVEGKDLTTTEAYSSDIYSKGAYFMHTLRYVLGDSIFFPTLKQFATDSSYTDENQVVTADLIKLLNTNSGKDLKPLFDLYIYSTKLPKIQIDSLSRNEYAVSIPNVDFELEMDVEYAGKTERFKLGPQQIVLETPFRPMVDEMDWYLK